MYISSTPRSPSECLERPFSFFVEARRCTWRNPSTFPVNVLRPADKHGLIACLSSSYSDFPAFLVSWNIWTKQCVKDTFSVKMTQHCHELQFELRNWMCSNKVWKKETIEMFSVGKMWLLKTKAIFCLLYMVSGKKLLFVNKQLTNINKHHEWKTLLSLSIVKATIVYDTFTSHNNKYEL